MRLLNPVPSLASLVPEAQLTVLPADRCRNLSTGASIELFALVKAQLARPPAPVDPGPTPTPTPAPDPEVRVEEVLVEVETPVAVRDLSVFKTKDLFEELVLRLGYFDRVEAVAPVCAPSPEPDEAPALSTTSLRRATVVVCGLLGKQFRQLEGRLDGLCRASATPILPPELHSIDQENPRGKDLPECDLAVVTRWRLKAAGPIRQRYGNDRVLFHEGGVGQLAQNVFNRLLEATCRKCGCAIPDARRLALPDADRCVTCAAESEK